VSWMALGLLTALSIVVGNSEVDMMPVDQTRKPGSSGTAVVDAVTRLIEATCVFPDDKLFFRRLAYVESDDGTDNNTYRAGYDGGIWQVKYTIR